MKPSTLNRENVREARVEELQNIHIIFNILKTNLVLNNKCTKTDNECRLGVPYETINAKVC